MGKKRHEQVEIPGTEQPRLPVIEKAAAAYVSARDERMSLTETEVARRGTLLLAMRAAGLEKYRCHDGRLVEVFDGEPVVKVRKGDAEAAEA